MPIFPTGPTMVPMHGSYAVSWREAGHAVSTGRLELGGAAFRLTAGDASSEVAYADVADLRLGRSGADRLNGRPALVVERRDRTLVRIWSLMQPGALSELAARLGENLSARQR